MKQFLDTIAWAYTDHYASSDSSVLSDFCFLFPNKRSATFFLKHLRHRLPQGTSILSPACMTISDLVTTLAGADADNRISLIFRLFKIYRRISNSDIDIHQFLKWGETLISDFNEVDLYNIPADQLFRNLENLSEISTDFLTDTQRAVLAKYFNYAFIPAVSKIDDSNRSIWTTSHNNVSGTPKKKFKSLWNSMFAIYSELNDQLKKENLATPGGLYRLADENLKAFVKHNASNPHTSPINGIKKIVAIGFNALSTRELSIFENLSKLKFINPSTGLEEDFIDFVWDLTGPILNPSDTRDIPGAANFVTANRKFFPEPSWLRHYLAYCSTSEMPERIRIISSPGNVQQSKIAGQLITEFKKEYIADRISSHKSEDDKTDERKKAEDDLQFLIKDAHVAVVLPDERLLFPTLTSFSDKEDVNLTMGYELKISPVMAFVRLLRLMHLRSNGHSGFLKKDVINVLQHTFCSIFLTHGYQRNLIKEIGKVSSPYLHPQSLQSIMRRLSAAHAEKGELIFRFIPEDATSTRKLAFIHETLSAIGLHMRKLPSKSSHLLDAENIAVYCDALRRLQETLHDHSDIMLPTDDLFRLSERLCANERVTFEGEPLQGLQIMGMLETRSLDFDFLVVTSLNEKILPKRGSRKSFITSTLRRAYGMPPIGYEESIFGYYFYRMLSRAKRVSLIYDSRVASGLGSGGMSRYLQQLIYQYGPKYMKLAEGKHFERLDYSYSIHATKELTLDVAKTETVRHKLEPFKKAGGKVLSATAIKKYCECQAHFFYEYVMDFREEDRPDEISDSNLGTVLHKVMEYIYRDNALEEFKSDDIISHPHKRGCDANTEAKSKHRQQDSNPLLPKPLEITADKIKRILDTPEHELIGKLLTGAINREFKKYDPNVELFAKLDKSHTIHYDNLLICIRKLLEKDLQRTPFEILGCEISRNLYIPSGKQNINFRFAIDRIDRISDGTIRIVDYKTGKPHVCLSTWDDLFSNGYNSKHALQLLIYARMAEHALWNNPVVPLDNPESLKFQILTPMALANKAEESDVMYIKKGEISPTIKDASFSQDIAGEFSSRLDEIIDSIFESNTFKANPGEACQYCHLKSICSST